MKHRIIKALIERDRKKRVWGTLPYKLEEEISASCPYTRQETGVIVCTINKKGYGCQPRQWCIFLVKEER